MNSKTDTKIRAKAIGKRIAQARLEAGGMSQRELAELIGVTERSVSAYEAGDVVPYRFLSKIEEALQRDKAWILYGDEAMRGSIGTLENQETMLQKLDDLAAKIDELLKKRAR